MVIIDTKTSPKPSATKTAKKSAPAQALQRLGLLRDQLWWQRKVEIREREG